MPHLPAEGELDADRHPPADHREGQERHSRGRRRRLVASVQTEQETLVPVNRGPAVGIDLGSAQAIVLSDGAVVDLPRTSADRKRLATAQRAVARWQKGSRTREKAKRRLARLQARYARRRRDAAHKATTIIVKNHGVVVTEDLKVKQMTRTGRGTVAAPGALVHKRANENRALLEVSPRTIRTLLEYKSLWYGSKLVVVNPAQTSQTCSACQAVDAASRISRSHFVCTSCGRMFDADVNAAKNILAIGISPTGGLPGMACESSRTACRKQEQNARRRTLGSTGPRVVTSRRARSTKSRQPDCAV
ncbi:transposase [Bradyrhizobium tropiciagri]|uniref:RNA-guided endonuclease InsQ/TnpB family protein n=1 Tax=Bradyrhizobium tropiciagri TaxID=312253 RepID=UPI001BAD7E70|nr:RNA-guided endonuclease TnpB family protein [Bradyrhizobium tropiciagri]MBR0898859.1 transposase [Bradyrhizobium tropiciagri]